MDRLFLVSIALDIAAPLYKPLKDAIDRWAEKAERRNQGIDNRDPKEVIRNSGLLEATGLGFPGIEKQRAMRLIRLSENSLPVDIHAIEDSGLREAAIALESTDRAYSEFVNRRGIDPESAIERLYGSRAADLYIRKTWPEQKMFEAATLCGGHYGHY
jgi:hypothetical protein